METLFRDRRHAGRELAVELAGLLESDGSGDAEAGGGVDPSLDGVVVIALPRGGVPVAFEVAQALHAPLDVLVVRKLGAPGHPELAIGAIASGGARVLNEELVRALRLDAAVIDRVAEVEERELARREALYRGGRPPLAVTDRTVVLVDDGIATGATMLVAVNALKQLRAGRVVAAAPVGAPDSLVRLRSAADAVVCLHRPRDLASVGQWYADFSQTTDAEVRELLTGHAF